MRSSKSPKNKNLATLEQNLSHNIQTFYTFLEKVIKKFETDTSKDLNVIRTIAVDDFYMPSQPIEKVTSIVPQHLKASIAELERCKDIISSKFKECSVVASQLKKKELLTALQQRYMHFLLSYHHHLAAVYYYSLREALINNKFAQQNPEHQKILSQISQHCKEAMKAYIDIFNSNENTSFDHLRLFDQSLRIWQETCMKAVTLQIHAPLEMFLCDQVSPQIPFSYENYLVTFAMRNLTYYPYVYFCEFVLRQAHINLAINDGSALSYIENVRDMTLQLVADEESLVPFLAEHSALQHLIYLLKYPVQAHENLLQVINKDIAERTLDWRLPGISTCKDHLEEMLKIRTNLQTFHLLNQLLLDIVSAINKPEQKNTDLAVAVKNLQNDLESKQATAVTLEKTVEERIKECDQRITQLTSEFFAEDMQAEQNRLKELSEHRNRRESGLAKPAIRKIEPEASTNPSVDKKEVDKKASEIESVMPHEIKLAQAFLLNDHAVKELISQGNLDLIKRCSPADLPKLEMTLKKAKQDLPVAEMKMLRLEMAYELYKKILRQSTDKKNKLQQYNALCGLGDTEESFAFVYISRSSELIQEIGDISQDTAQVHIPFKRRNAIINQCIKAHADFKKAIEHIELAIKQFKALLLEYKKNNDLPEWDFNADISKLNATLEKVLRHYQVLKEWLDNRKKFVLNSPKNSDRLSASERKILIAKGNLEKPLYFPEMLITQIEKRILTLKDVKLKHIADEYQHLVEKHTQPLPAVTTVSIFKPVSHAPKKPVTPQPSPKKK